MRAFGIAEVRRAARVASSVYCLKQRLFTFDLARDGE
jgi:hypothetical protein